MQFLTTGVIAEILTRIFYQSREQPGALGGSQEPAPAEWRGTVPPRPVSISNHRG
jgi:hypothetical protein